VGSVVNFVSRALSSFEDCFDAFTENQRTNILLAVSMEKLKARNAERKLGNPPASSFVAQLFAPFAVKCPCLH
jgi:hypothetical protein